MMFFDYLPACISGVLLGYIVGLLPGVGVSMVLIILFPFLIKINLPIVLIFYCSMVSAAQYGGSVTALALGLPGEQNSYPLLSVRPKIIEENKQTEALFFCAIGHFLGSLLVFVFSYFIIDILSTQSGYLKTWVMVSLCSVGLLLSILSSENNIFTSIVLMVLAWFLGKVGIDNWTGKEFLTFQNSYLSGGLPFVAVITGIWVIPFVLKQFRDKNNLSIIEFKQDIQLRYLINDLVKRYGSVLRGSIIGFFVGLIPYIGVDISSYVGFYIEKYFNKDSVSQIITAEVATNGAAIAMLLPLLIYGIAIQPSENILLEIVNNSNRIVIWETVKPIFPYLSLFLIIANLLSFILSWNLASPALNAFLKIKKFIPFIMLFMCFYSMFAVGSLNGTAFYHMVVMCVFGLLGWVLRNVDKLPFVLMYLLHAKLEPAIMRLLTIYL